MLKKWMGLLLIASMVLTGCMEEDFYRLNKMTKQYFSAVDTIILEDYIEALVAWEEEIATTDVLDVEAIQNLDEKLKVCSDLAEELKKTIDTSTEKGAMRGKIINEAITPLEEIKQYTSASASAELNEEIQSDIMLDKIEAKMQLIVSFCQGKKSYTMQREGWKRYLKHLLAEK